MVSLGGGGITVRQLGGCRAGEMRVHRFLRNPAVTVAEIVATAAARTAERCAGRHVLAIQDTTNVRADAKGGNGLRLHPTIMLDAMDGAILGLAHAEFLDPGSGQAAGRKQRSVEDKESRRWINGAAAAHQVAAAAEHLTVVADRESDIYEAFVARPAGCSLLVRAAQDRRVVGGSTLFPLTDTLAVGGQVTVDLPAAPGRAARQMTLDLRFSEIELLRPKTRDAAGLPETISLWVVDAREVDAPAGQPPAHWRLLTNDRINDVADARRIIRLYRQRWAIEQVFRTLKTKGFDIEAVRMEDDRPRRVLVAITLVAALLVQQMAHDRDGQAGRPIEDAFDPDDQPALQALCAKLEGKTERQKNPHPPDSLAYAAWVCARLGGWTGYYGKPGPIVLVRGWLAFQRIKHGWDLAHALL
jgi:hypothetical protein